MYEQPMISYIPFLKAPGSYQFASSVLMFGELLRQSKFAKDINWNTILNIATASAEPDNFPQKEFITLVQQARIIYSKKKKKGKD